MPGKLKDLIFIDQAAKEVGMHRDRLKKICIQAGIAIRWGGTDAKPRLKVLMDDVERVILSMRELPPDKVNRVSAFRGKLDPSVKC